MLDSKGQNFSGLLVDWPEGKITKSLLLNCPGLFFNRDIKGTKWELFTFEANTPCSGEDPALNPPPYKYDVLCRRSNARMLIMSFNRLIIDHIVEKPMAKVFPPRLYRVNIGIDKLVKALVERPTKYALTFAHARSPAFGTSLRSISYYGNDLAEASMFSENAKLMNYFTCGLRNIKGGLEIIRMSREGIISFYSAEPNRLLEVESTLRYLRKNNYLPNNPLISDTEEEHDE